MRRNSLPRKKRDVRGSRGVKRALGGDGASEDVVVEAVEVHGSVEEVDCVLLLLVTTATSLDVTIRETFASRSTNAASGSGSDTRLDAYMLAKAISSTTHRYQQLIPADFWSQAAHGDYPMSVIRVLLEGHACERTKDEIKCPTIRHTGPLIISLLSNETILPEEADQARYIAKDLAHLTIENSLRSWICQSCARPNLNSSTL